MSASVAVLLLLGCIAGIIIALTLKVEQALLVNETPTWASRKLRWSSGRPVPQERLRELKLDGACLIEEEWETIAELRFGDRVSRRMELVQHRLYLGTLEAVSE